MQAICNIILHMKMTRTKYVEYLISTPQNYTCSNLADHLEKISHDVVTDYLQRERLTARHSWQLAQQLIEDFPESYLIVDDSVQNKQYSKSIEMVKRQYSGAVGGLVRGIGVVNLVHTNGKGDFCPIDYRIYAKEYDGKTKNDHFQEMLIRAVYDKQVKARTILFDSWYASCSNLKLINRLQLVFYTTLKSNRIISLDQGENWHHLNELHWTEEMEQFGVLVRLSKIPFTVKLFKLVATNGDIDWVVTNYLDSALSTQIVQHKNDVRWEVEQFHRELKQLTGSEKCQCRKQRSQRTHLANCYHAWFTLKEKARACDQTVYKQKQNLFRDYLQAELRHPTIPAMNPI